MADGGGVRPGSDAEETGVPQQRGPEAACAADGSGRPAVQRTLSGPGEEGQSLGVMQKFMKYCHILVKNSREINESSHQNVNSVLTLCHRGLCRILYRLLLNLACLSASTRLTCLLCIMFHTHVPIHSLS